MGSQPNSSTRRAGEGAVGTIVRDADPAAAGRTSVGNNSGVDPARDAQLLPSSKSVGFTDSAATSSSRAKAATLADLRKVDSLNRLPNRRVGEMSIFDQASVSEESSDDESTRGAAARKKNKLKSGKLLKTTSHVKRQEAWPHAFLSGTHPGVSEKKYDELTIPEFVSGFVSI